MRKNPQQKDEMSARSNFWSFITSIFKGAQANEIKQVELADDQDSSELSVITEALRPVHAVRTGDWYEKMHESIDEVTDRSIAESQLTADKFKPSPWFFTNWSQYKLIHTLYVRGEVSRRELGDLVDIANIPDLVARMNRLG